MTASSRARLRRLPASNPHRPDIHHLLALSLAAKFEDRSNPADLDEAIDILRDSLSTTPPQHPSRSIFLSNLGEMLFNRFEQDQDERFQDLEESIALHRDALKLRPSLHPDRPMSLLHLARDLFFYFRLKEAPLDLEEHIEIWREALELLPSSHTIFFLMLSDLAHVVYLRFENGGEFEDLEESIMIYRKLLQMDQTGALPDPAMIYYNLANALSSRFDQKNDSNDRKESIILYRKALAIQPPPHPDRHRFLTNLGHVLCTHSAHTVASEDVGDAITVFRELLDLQHSSHPNRFSSLKNLATVLSEQFDRAGDLQDIEDSITLNREALMLRPPPHPDSLPTLIRLANNLLVRYEQRGNFHDLEESILLCRKALTLQRINHVDCSSPLVSLACALSARFDIRGDVQDIEDSISLYREALTLTPVSHPSYATAISNLCSATTHRFEHRGIFQDLEDVIALYRKALELDTESRIYPGLLLNNLALALWRRFELNAVSDDIEECILLHREALRMRPHPHPDRYVSLVNLANALARRSLREGNLSDVEEGIILYREALVSLPHNHSDYLWALQQLASALSERSKLRNSAVDLDESISLYKLVVSSETTSYPTRPSLLSNLAKTLRLRFIYCGDHQDLEDALNYCEEASKYEAGFIFPRFHASIVWANIALEFRPTYALDAHSYAIALLPLLASVDLTLQQRQEVLRHSEMLVGNAVRSAINASQCEEAVVFISTGRSVFWSQALQLRTSESVEELAASHPILAREFTIISRQLEKTSYSGHRSILDSVAQVQLNAGKQMSPAKLADKRSQLLEKIREIPGFERFLLPPLFLSLQAAAEGGPLILLNASCSDGCDALILRRNSVDVVPLLLTAPGILDDLQLLFDMTCNAEIGVADNSKYGTPPLGEQPGSELTCDHSSRNPTQNVSQTDISSSWAGVARRTADSLGIETEGLLGRDMGRATDSLGLRQNKFRFALHCLWTGVVKPVLQEMGLKKTDVPDRIWWCPTGPFTSFPIHAAGVYAQNNLPIDCLFQYAVSSYCTSPQDLIHPPPPVASSFQMTAIIEPDAPGSQPLPATLKELQAIEKHVGSCLITYVGSRESPNQVDNFFCDIQQSSLVHFGCHGMQDLNNPLESYLLMSGGKLTMSKIIKECRVPEGALAYLSACETAKADESRPDESLNLVATMMFAGFRSVVGTMWSIFDDDAPVVADIFYGHLFRNGKNVHPDIRDAAYGLHLATKELRARGKPFENWVPYVHYGI